MLKDTVVIYALRGDNQKIIQFLLEEIGQTRGLVISGTTLR